MTKIPYKLHEIIKDIPINTYHATPGTYSSSQFKSLLDDEDEFIKKYITKEIEREESPAFDVGTYFHTALLEPEKLKKECVVYPKKIRRGQHWEKFKKAYAGKVILNINQKEQGDKLVKAVKASEKAMEYLVGKPELSLFTEINVHQGKIYAPHYGKELTIEGWVDGPLKRFKDAFAFIVKVRSDTLGKTFISDLKSTSGNARSERSMKNVVSRYEYDLSAALYLDMFRLKLPALQEFVWIFASKELYNSKSYRATELNMKVGRAKYMKAMIRMADCAANDWKLIDCVGNLDPNLHELEYLKEFDRDLV